MADLVLSAQDGWEQVSAEAMQKLLDYYGGEPNLKLALSTDGIGIISIIVDEDRFPEPYTAVESAFIGGALWIKVVLTSSL